MSDDPELTSLTYGELLQREQRLMVTRTTLLAEMISNDGFSALESDEQDDILRQLISAWDYEAALCRRVIRHGGEDQRPSQLDRDGDIVAEFMAYLSGESDLDPAIPAMPLSDQGPVNFFIPEGLFTTLRAGNLWANTPTRTQVLVEPSADPNDSVICEVAYSRRLWVPEDITDLEIELGYRWEGIDLSDYAPSYLDKLYGEDNWDPENIHIVALFNREVFR